MLAKGTLVVVVGGGGGLYFFKQTFFFQSHKNIIFKITLPRYTTSLTFPLARIMHHVHTHLKLIQVLLV